MELSLVQHVLLLLAAAAAGVINAMAGGGSLITFPALVAVGLPAMDANVTNAAALFPGQAAAAFALRRDLAEQKQIVRRVALPAALGGLAGSVVLLVVGDGFERIAPWMVLLATLLLMFEPWIKRKVKDRGGDSGAPRWMAALLATFAASFYGGFFGAGFGIMVLAVLSLTLPGTTTQINALKLAVTLCAKAAAVILFTFSGHVVWTAAVVMAVGSITGGALGGRLAHKVRPKFLRYVIIAIGVIATIAFFVRLR